MSDIIKYISKVEIKGLWGRFDLSWDLNEDVNILSGINGSGKSTVLNCLYIIIRNGVFVKDGRQIDDISAFFTDCKIIFNNGAYVLYELVKYNKDLQEQGEKINDESRYQYLEQKFYDKKTFDPTASKYLSPTGIISYVTASISLLKLSEFLLIDFVSTFDTELKSLQAKQKKSDGFIKTELDWEIDDLQIKYLEYKLNIGKKIAEAINRKASNEELVKISMTQNRFLYIIDALFEQTGKIINRTENKISFLSGEEKITAYQLSSGEKQMLIILLTVLVQDNKNAILFMDEPEVSLHFDWQEKLIGYIRELNPNVQVILATHSPAVILEGWIDKVSEISDLITLDRKSEINAAK